MDSNVVNYERFKKDMMAAMEKLAAIPVRPLATELCFHPSEWTAGLAWVRRQFPGRDDMPPEVLGIMVRPKEGVIPGFFEVHDQNGKLMSKGRFQ